MSSFAVDLANRLTKNSAYWSQFHALQSAGAGSTLPQGLEKVQENPSTDDLVKLLYCAAIFVQTENEDFKSMAQSIALNSLLVSLTNETHERSVRVLTELGNFPGLSYVESNYDVKITSISSLLQRRISQALNTVQVGGGRIALTDYQKAVWDALPESKALAVSAPTSAGKSFLVIEHLCRLAVCTNNFIAVYIAPTRALLSEVYQAVKTRVAHEESVRVSSVPSLDAEDKPKQIFILTQERLQVLLAVSDLSFDMIVVDEAQNLSDGSRGMILQECLDQAIQRNVNTRIVLLAPGAEGFDEAAGAIGIRGLSAKSTTVSPVLQNRILVNKVSGKNELFLQLLTQGGPQEIGRFKSARGFDIESTRLASVALELGESGGSLVYATGPSEAERVAKLLIQGRDDQNAKELNDLSKFIGEHIHPEYALAAMVKKGVAFHYGKMPTLLRESLENAFKSGAIQFLACTTTLFQGVNLPARNVFIDTPTRGAGTPLDPALLWNFAGRAGRMMKDIVGNVFLVDYDDWPEKPMNEFARFKIRPALKVVLTDHHNEVLHALDGNMPKRNPRDDLPDRIRASAGLLIARAAKGDIDSFITRVLPGESKDRAETLSGEAKKAFSKLNLPSNVLSTNWMIDPFGQKRLYDRIVEKIHAEELEDLIPINPHEKGASTVYGGIFSRILKAIYGQNGNFGGYVSSVAIPWMQGKPYPAILGMAIRKARRNAEKKEAERALELLENPQKKFKPLKPVDPDQIIRSTFDIIEDVVRFQFVQLGKAYIDLLATALKSEGLGNRIPDIFDFSLALELGIATKSGRSFVELGLSRIAAAALEVLYPNSNLAVSDARKWLWDIDIEILRLSPIIVAEIRGLGLMKPVEVA